MPDVSVTWLGHAAFRVDSPNGKRVYVDPWLDNPRAPDGEQEPERVDVVAVTHGHDDHVGGTVEISKKFSPEIVALIELKGWLGDQGANVGEMPGLNKDVTDDARLHEAHERGTPVVVRADTQETIVAALKRPEVACVLVPADKAELLELDLRELT